MTRKFKLAIGRARNDPTVAKIPDQAGRHSSPSPRRGPRTPGSTHSPGSTARW